MCTASIAKLNISKNMQFSEAKEAFSQALSLCIYSALVLENREVGMVALCDIAPYLHHKLFSFYYYWD